MIYIRPTLALAVALTGSALQAEEETLDLKRWGIAIEEIGHTYVSYAVRESDGALMKVYEDKCVWRETGVEYFCSGRSDSGQATTTATLAPENGLVFRHVVGTQPEFVTKADVLDDGSVRGEEIISGETWRYTRRKIKDGVLEANYEGPDGRKVRIVSFRSDTQDEGLLRAELYQRDFAQRKVETNRSAQVEDPVARFYRIQAELNAALAASEAQDYEPVEAAPRPSMAEAFAGAFAQATADNAQTTAALQNSINRGLAQGIAQSRAVPDGGRSQSGSAAPPNLLGSSSSVTAAPTAQVAEKPGGLVQKSIRVWYSLPMQATDRNTVNPLCISNTFSVTVQWDPKGWGNPGRVAEAIKPMEGRFIAECRQRGTLAGSVAEYHAEGMQDGFADKPNHPEFIYVGI